ncbi:MAG: hypothetical protein HND56_00805 [Pseudomonadota bacterium]|nr:hypothetical protein [Pseudomonadota bacterium]QKK04306.1 MAG: hypothetical protein HND56_00805 [Pseudomonadota bacterium]
MQEQWTEFILWNSPVKSLIIAVLGFLISTAVWMVLTRLFPGLRKGETAAAGWPPARFAVLIPCLFGIFMLLKAPPYIAVLDSLGTQHPVLKILYEHHPDLKDRITARIAAVMELELPQDDAVEAVTVILLDEIMPHFGHYMMKASPEAIHSLLRSKSSVLDGLMRSAQYDTCADYITGKTARLRSVSVVIGDDAVINETYTTLGIIESALQAPNDPSFYTTRRLERRLEAIYRDSGQEDKIKQAMQNPYMTNAEMCFVSTTLFAGLIKLDPHEASDIYKNILLLSP